VPFTTPQKSTSIIRSMSLNSEYDVAVVGDAGIVVHLVHRAEVPMARPVAPITSKCDVTKMVVDAKTRCAYGP
jgi:hypothetical protein